MVPCFGMLLQPINLLSHSWHLALTLAVSCDREASNNAFSVNPDVDTEQLISAAGLVSAVSSSSPLL